MRLPAIPGAAVTMPLLLVAAVGGAEPAGERFLDLTRAGKPAATLVVPDDRAPIWDDAIALLTTTAERWGSAVPRVVRLARSAPLPAGNLILLGTPATSDAIAGLARQTESPVSRVPLGDPHGFAVEAQAADGAKRLVLAGATPRGAYNGAVFCRDFLLDATAGPAGKADVFARRASLARSPHLAARGTYLLSIYGVAMKYTAEDWMKVIDRHAEDGMNRVCFWLSGHHPSRKYPHLYNRDATKGTRLTVDGVRRLIRHCHDRGIAFYIGGGVFAWVASAYLAEGHPEAAAVGAAGLCPSQPFARAATREHFLEMYDTWPEADGFLFEIRDEHGECRCPACRAKLDAFGSRDYGRAEITWLQKFAREAWKRNDRLRFCWLIGYDEHKSDVAYYEQIRRMSDPRFEWLDARVGLDPKGPWRLPGPGGEPRPLAFFGRQISHWDPFYKLPIDRVLTAARRSADEGLYGYVPAFEPGFGSASYYGDQVPLPVHLLPYCLTGLVYREATWEPALSLDALKERIHNRYFSPDAPKRFVEDMIYLQQFSFDYGLLISQFARPRFGYEGEKHDRLTVEGERKRVQSLSDPQQRKAAAARLRQTFDQLAGVAGHLRRMDGIEAAMKEAEPAATPKTRDGFALLRRMIDDTRKFYREAVPDPRALAEPVPE